MLSTMVAGEASQNTPYKLHMFSCFRLLLVFMFPVVLFYTLIPVKVLLVNCMYLLIRNKANNLTGEFWVLSLGFSSFYEANFLLVQCYTKCYLSATADYGNEL